MGCDIHVHVEIKIRGQWRHYSSPYIGGPYDLFAKMAGVRSRAGGPTPIAMPRDLPGDISDVTKIDALLWAGDGHSHSWLSAGEASAVEDWMEEKEPGNWHPPLFGYVFGNRIGTFVRYPEGWRPRRLRELGVEDMRVVFWLDN